MLLAYTMPSATIGLGGTASWVSADAGASLLDEKPASRSRLAHGWELPLLSSQFASLVLTFDGAQIVHVVGLLSLSSVPPGAVVHIFGRRLVDGARTYTFGGANTGQVAEFADGTRGVWIVLPSSAEAVTELEFRIFNSDGGGSWGTPGGLIDVGEVVAMPAVEIPIDAGMQISRIDPSVRTRTRGSQLATVPRPSYRQCAVTASISTDSVALYGGLGGTDWTRIIAAIGGGRRCVAIPRWKTGGVVAPSKVNAFAMYAEAEVGELKHLRGPFWNFEATFREIPSIA
jgi:hypothetical protein